MGYMNSFADEISSGRSMPVKTKNFWNSPVFIASVMAVSAGITFFSVKSILNSDAAKSGAETSPTLPAVVDVVDDNTTTTAAPTTTTTTTASTTTTAAPTTTTTTTTTTAAPTTTTTAAPVNQKRFAKAYLLNSAEYPEIHIPGIKLPDEYERGLLDPEAVFWLVNEIRTNNGLAPFERGGSKLELAAKKRAIEVLDDFSQTRPDGSSYRSVFGQFGIEYDHCLESVGYGQYTAEHLVSDWLDSKSNKENILNPDCKCVYIVCEIGDDNIPIWIMSAYSPKTQTTSTAAEEGSAAPLVTSPDKNIAN